VKGASESAVAQRNGGATDSLQKLHKVLQLCADLGVITQPTQLGGLLLVPLLSWHHAVSAFTSLLIAPAAITNSSGNPFKPTRGSKFISNISNSKKNSKRL
jgi:hypothetical protein